MDRVFNGLPFHPFLLFDGRVEHSKNMNGFTGSGEQVRACPGIWEEKDGKMIHRCLGENMWIACRSVHQVSRFHSACRYAVEDHHYKSQPANTSYSL